MTKILVDKSLLEQAIEAINAAADSWGQSEIPTVKIYAAEEKLRAALAEPAVEPATKAMTGCKCNCPASPVSVDKAWAQFCGGIGRGPDAPYPGMIEAFEAHYAQSFADRDWRNETGVWAAAWKAAKAIEWADGHREDEKADAK